MQSKKLEVKRLVVGPIYTNCYLISYGDELAVIDPGGEVEKILLEIKKINKKVKYIINTHFHFDHTLCNPEIKKDTNAQILIHENESSFLDFKPDKYLVDGDRINIGGYMLKVILTPGHSVGSICLIGENCIFTGDTLFDNSCGRTDLPGGSDDDMHHSLEKLKNLITPTMDVFPGHGDIFKGDKAAYY